MIEKEFKRLNHQFGDYRPMAFGSELCEGYRPDLTLRNRRNRLAFIIEFEAGPSRKTLVGCLTKAQKCCEDKGQSATLLIILRERRNTTREQVASHLKPYLKWFKKRRTKKAGVSHAFVMTDQAYETSVSCKEAFASTEFWKRCLDVGD